jgi:hypothetical protein
MSNQREEIFKDIQRILKDWKQICKDHSLLERVDFLEKMHAHILTLETHSQQFKKDKTLHALIFHILHTPSGAPNVTKETLYESSKSFCREKAKESSFHLFLQKSLNSSNEEDNYLFNCLSIVKNELKKVA